MVEGSLSWIPVLILTAAFCQDNRRENPGGALRARCRLPQRSVYALLRYSTSGRKITSLPNNRSNEMIGGCEIRSIFGECPPPRPLHDDAVERRLILHGF
jgi:hypothetical protein